VTIGKHAQHRGNANVRKTSRWFARGEPILSRTSGLRSSIDEWQPVLLRRPSVMVMLTGFLLLLFLIPARLVIGGMGAIGRPAIAVGLLLGFLWLAGLLQSSGLTKGFQPVRWLLAGYVGMQLLGYVVGYDRGLPAVEASGADRWMILTIAMAGVALAVADALTDRRQLDRLLLLLVAMAATMALVGVLQFFGIVDLTRYIRLPGLGLNTDLIGVDERGGPGFARVAGTATHYIEFGVVLAMILPLALHYAFFASTVKQKWLRWSAVGLIASGIPFSVSRAATLSVLVSVTAIASVWPWRRKLNAVVVALLAVVAFRMVQPGLLGTIKALFTNADDDPSVQDRIARTGYVIDLWQQRPWFGRGSGTVLPDRYILLDNQYYGTLLAGGVIGLIGLVVFFFLPYLASRSIRLRGADEQTRHLAQALAAPFLVTIMVSATFDSLSFGTYTGVLFLLIGAVGALWRLDGGGAGRRALQYADPGAHFVSTPLMARWQPPVRTAAAGDGRRLRTQSTIPQGSNKR